AMTNGDRPPEPSGNYRNPCPGFTETCVRELLKSVSGNLRNPHMYTLIVTAKMNDIDPQAWLADVLARLPDMPVARIHELLPWNWKQSLIAKAA
ncbi:transposase domain-containing protein, partial [Pararhodobacter oceanensis]|uniref:transposase domain-containing protein n=1 Tax=Pararhodobacter oceanensis TaxID=2172121 RepID=UPI001F0BF3FD